MCKKQRFVYFLLLSSMLFLLMSSTSPSEVQPILEPYSQLTSQL